MVGCRCELQCVECIDGAADWRLLVSISTASPCVNGKRPGLVIARLEFGRLDVSWTSWGSEEDGDSFPEARERKSGADVRGLLCSDI